MDGTCNPSKCAECKAQAHDLPPAQLFEFWWHCSQADNGYREVWFDEGSLVSEVRSAAPAHVSRGVEAR